MHQRCVGFKSWFKSISPNIKNQPIAIFGNKNTALVSFVFAILETENGYLPINPDWPAERISFIFRQSNLHGCIVENKYLGILTKALVEGEVAYNELAINDDYTFIRSNMPTKVFPENLAYVLFTSGSTGFPKGIVHSADSIIAFLKWCKKEFAIYKVNKFVSIAPLNFDLSVFDLFFPLITKKTLVIPEYATISNPRLFAQYIVTNKIEAVYTTPSYLNLLLQTTQLHKYDLKSVKLVLIAGEQLSYDLVLELKNHFVRAAFYNLYGPTETNVTTYYKIDFESINKNDINVPIGKACYSLSVKLNRNSELLYKGKLLMKAVIDEDGISTLKAGSLFNTGDKVKKLKTGNLMFVGRRDSMIKRNGFRIELPEIKKALLCFAGISKSEVIASDNPKVEIIAFVETENQISELQLRTFLLNKLPSYMLPDMIIVMKNFPMNLNHKVDIQKLKENFI